MEKTSCEINAPDPREKGLVTEPLTGERGHQDARKEHNARVIDLAACVPLHATEQHVLADRTAARRAASRPRNCIRLLSSIDQRAV